MALIALQTTPVGNWDTLKSLTEQTLEAQDYYNNILINNSETIFIQEECCFQGSGIFRWLKKYHSDTANSLRIVLERVYLLDKFHKNCFAVQEHKSNMEQ